MANIIAVFQCTFNWQCNQSVDTTAKVCF